IYDISSNWSEPLTVDMGEPILEIESITGGLLKTNAIVSNSGDRDADEVAYEVSISGGFLITGQYSTGVVANIPAGDYTSISSGFIIGFGKILISIYIDDTPYSVDTKDQEAFVFLFLVI
ncbi:MAG: hypothetical protein KKC68_06020, partial [Candidatus Thermoplasmatota archaeon]|nr:hypothetical protein [Candidatus Thermoplasmatota archaeon]